MITTGQLSDRGGTLLPRRWLYLLTLALAVELLFGVEARWGRLGRFLHGGGGAGSVVAVLGLGWLVMLLVVTVALARSLARARHTLHRQDQRITAVASTTREWLWETDPEFTFTYHSPGVEDLLGYRPEELVGVGVGELMIEEDDQSQVDRLAQGRGYTTGWESVERLWRHREGHAVALQGTGVALRDESGRLIGYGGTRTRVADTGHLQRAAALARARVQELLSTGAVNIALQPIASLFTGRLVGAEALARFDDGRPPDVWFEEAREAGLTRDLEALTFTAALARFSALPRECYLSVNAGPGLIMDPAFQSSLREGGVPLDRLVIEITEHDRIHDYAALNLALAPLRELGVRLAVDDTGAGYASLSHVLQLRPNIIKIDRSLIAQLSSDPARRSLVTALVLLALDIGASVTGEGVETAAELSTLIDLGVDSAQGYLLSRPTTDPAHWRAWPGVSWVAAGAAGVDRTAPKQRGV
jgi:PAS domain S-box-containing protein